ncbi:MAG: fibronectin type III domain-containing protein [Candidatus Eisenbacteria bacterium]|uniref:Fibronectin type III domain-containing protein n=1 Tax=Eiseniibacteriota bacterium TaxID=2212470 RepID=A0A948W4V0_UNCEI|nr:fibronectin type III domain-containing protein [Candidatus Eisenbacteria bacterium]MBU1949574.1 fibronectin type III domain-containing protein [Candidatus Eisenbacteria bacterium]MBU2689350.1 fibronectin type III domain-containing protein [Candidatus Eisenbacteria bacterium]
MSSLVTLDWADTPGAVGYRVQVGTSCGGGSEITVNSSQYPLSDLSEGTTYYWRVKAKNNCGTWGTYSDSYSFATSPNRPPRSPHRRSRRRDDTQNPIPPTLSMLRHAEFFSHPS